MLVPAGHSIQPYYPRTFVLHAIPQPGETHQLAVCSFDIVRELVSGSGLEPLIESLCNDDASLPCLHGCPHATRGAERIRAAIDGLEHGSIVWVTFRPERNQAPFHGLQLVARRLLVILVMLGFTGRCVRSWAGTVIRCIGPVHGSVVTRRKVV